MMYIPESIRAEKDFQDCIQFHGHTCMGVTIGYLAAKLALNQLGIKRSVDEELVAIVENDACCCDAIQVLTGCTFGKGNFFFKDHGKMAFTFANRTSGEAIRLVLKPGVFDSSEEEQKLAELIRSGNSTPKDKQRYEMIFEARGEKFFSHGPEAFFEIQKITLQLPPKATRSTSHPCECCGEMVMRSKLEEVNNRLVCKGCRVISC
jgi:formylmethanofuran dehydrogenase subunit E